MYIHTYITECNVLNIFEKKDLTIKIVNLVMQIIAMNISRSHPSF